MDSISLTRLADEQLEAAHASHAGRAAHTIHGGHDHLLRQTVIALTAGNALAEHTAPGQATLQVLRGHVRLRAGDDGWRGEAGDYLLIPRDKQSLHADDDAVVLLTVLADS